MLRRKERGWKAGPRPFGRGFIPEHGPALSILVHTNARQVMMPPLQYGHGQVYACPHTLTSDDACINAHTCTRMHTHTL